MSADPNSSRSASHTWLQRWDPEDATAWAQGGSGLAWRTLSITTLNLMMAFAAWFMVSALVVRLPQAGFLFTPSQLFWLAAMPGLAGGTLLVPVRAAADRGHQRQYPPFRPARAARRCFHVQSTSVWSRGPGRDGDADTRRASATNGNRGADGSSAGASWGMLSEISDRRQRSYVP